MYKEKIVNAITGEETWRDYTDEEVAEVEAAKAKAAELATERDLVEKAKLALLEKLGITEEEAKLLLS